MEREQPAIAPEDALKDIRGMMAKSSRFISLSGWSGVWAGCVALVAAVIARALLAQKELAIEYYRDYRPTSWATTEYHLLPQLFLLAAITFITAFAGSYYFTWRKANAQGLNIWSPVSRQLMWQVMIPMIVGGMFCLSFVYYGAFIFLVPACLAFYGLALINGSKYTVGEIRWLGYCEVVMAGIAIFLPGYGLYFMATGFGILHILYGIFMWNKYDKRRAA